MKKILLFSISAAMLFASSSDIEELKKLLQKQQKVIEALQKKVDELENQNVKREANELKAKIEKADTYSASFNQNAFLPDIAFIINSSAVSRNVKNSDYENFSIPGFIDAGEAELPFDKNRGFNLNYAELALHSVVDPYFDAFAIFHLHPDEFEIEEAYVTTRDLPYHLRVKAGKFRSDFGRINAKHQHAWNFDTQPLVYKAMFGPDGISDPGIQLHWVAPTDTYILAGVEAFQGNNDRSFGDTEENNLYVGYLKTSKDITDTTTILAGVSIANGKNKSGHKTNVYGIDLTTQTFLSSYSSLTWQSELLYRAKKESSDVKDNQAGFYTQLVYKINKNYSTGIRYDLLYKNIANEPDDLDRYTAMVEYKPFPMSRLRLQYSHDRSKVINGSRKDIDELILSLNIAAGAHPAHAF